MRKQFTSSNDNRSPPAIVTGASSVIGYYLARQCIEHRFDLLIAADDPKINNVAKQLCASGASVDAVETDLATTLGADEVVSAIKGRPVEKTVDSMF